LSVGVRFAVHVTPRASATVVAGVGPAGELRVRVTGAPVDGIANRMLLRLLARELGVPVSAVRLETGAAGRLKRVAVDGVGRDALLRRWPGVSATSR
jgi:uncharacterized protein YggU (UPF0235/DUF167 family)